MTNSDYRTALSTIQWVQQNIELVQWDPFEFEKLFGARSAKDILASKKTSYMAPCLDLTLVLIHLLKKQGYDPKLIVEERVSSRTNQPTLHFAAEIPMNKKILTVDFTEGSRVI